MKKTPEITYLEKLKTLAPNICFSVSREPDLDSVWDGEGPDPEEAGYVAYNVDVRARAIVCGKLVCAEVSLGSSYYRDDEPLGDVHGYLPQMLLEAAEDLGDRYLINDHNLREVIQYLKQVMRDEYIKQRTEIEKKV